MDSQLNQILNLVQSQTGSKGEIEGLVDAIKQILSQLESGSGAPPGAGAGQGQNFLQPSIRPRSFLQPTGQASPGNAGYSRSFPGSQPSGFLSEAEDFSNGGEDQGNRDLTDLEKERAAHFGELDKAFQGIYQRPQPQPQQPQSRELLGFGSSARRFGGRRRGTKRSHKIKKSKTVKRKRPKKSRKSIRKPIKKSRKGKHHKKARK